jgi:hypothetical protein
MMTCPICKNDYPSGSGLSAHWRIAHPDTWKGGIESSLPEGVTFESLGTPEPRNKKKPKRVETPEQTERRRRQQRESYYRTKARKRGEISVGQWKFHDQPMLARIKFCPNCGFNLEIVNIALGMAEKAQGNK